MGCYLTLSNCVQVEDSLICLQLLKFPQALIHKGWEIFQKNIYKRWLLCYTVHCQRIFPRKTRKNAWNKLYTLRSTRNARIQRNPEGFRTTFPRYGQGSDAWEIERLASSAPRLVKRRRRGRFSWRLGNFCPGLQPCRCRQRILWLLWKRKFALPLFLLSFFTKSLSGFRERILSGIFQNRISVFFVYRRNSGRYFLKKAHAGLKIEAGE